MKTAHTILSAFIIDDKRWVAPAKNLAAAGCTIPDRYSADCGHDFGLHPVCMANGARTYREDSGYNSYTFADGSQIRNERGLPVALDHAP